MRRLAVLGALLALLALPSAASALELGFNDDWSGRPLWQPTTPATLSELGATSIRVPFDWNVPAERRQARRVIGEAHAAGVTTLIVPFGHDNPPASWKLYRHTVVSFAREFPFAPIEIWLEPNNPAYGGMGPVTYAHLWRYVANGVRSLPHPPRLFAAAAVEGPCRSDSPFDRIFAAKTDDLRYRLSVHIYPGGCSQFWTDNPANMVHAVMSREHHIAPGRGLWVTEVGYSSGIGGEDEQARVLGGEVAALERRSHLDRIYVHRLYDLDPLQFFYSSAKDAGWGVVAPDGSLKPAADALTR